MGASHRRGGPVTTQRDKEARPAPDLAKVALGGSPGEGEQRPPCDFIATGPNQFWVADATYAPAAAGFLSLAVVLDT